MILRYGQFANAVCDHTGKVIISTVYAKTVKLLGMDLLVYVLPEGKEEIALKYFSKNMGVRVFPSGTKDLYTVFLPKRHGYGKRTGFQASVAIQRCMKRRLYHTSPRIMRILDFGAGQKDYATILKKKGYLIDAIEFFHRKDGADIIDERKSGKTVLPYARPCRTTGCTMWLCAIAC